MYNLREMSSIQGMDLTWYHELDEIISNIISHMDKKRWHFYLHFLQDVFCHADKYDNLELKRKILTEMKRAIKKDKSATREDKAMYYDYEGGMAGNPLRAIALSHKAADILPKDIENILLKINIYQNLFAHNVRGSFIDEAIGWCQEVDKLYMEHPECVDHNYLTFQINRAAIYMSIGQNMPALRGLQACKQMIMAAGMEGSQDNAIVNEYIAALSIKLDRPDVARKALEESGMIYEKVFKETPEKAEEKRLEISATRNYLEKLERGKGLPQRDVAGI